MGDELKVTQAFFALVDKRKSDECWPWLGGYGSRGSEGVRYGRFRNRPAHQVAWEIKNGKPFPEGKNGCHSCDNPNCVNPNHIWPGTQSENIQDCVAKGRHASKPQSHCKRGHELSGDNRVLLPGGGSRCRECRRAGGRERTARWRAAKGNQNA